MTKEFLKNNFIYRSYALIKDIYTFLIKSVDPNYNKKRIIHKGKFISIFPNIHLTHPEDIYMGDFTRIQSGFRQISKSGRIIIKKYSGIAPDCIFINNSHVPTVGVPHFLLAPLHINDKDNDIIVEEDVWIGARCILLPNCIIGRGAIVGAGSIVTKPVPPYAVVAGAPAKIIACKFNIEQILEHEIALYPPNERMNKDELEVLFQKYYKDKKTIGISTINKNDQEKLIKLKRKFGISSFS